MVLALTCSASEERMLRAEERGGGWLLEAMCELPKLPIQPTKEGSTGVLRSFV